MSNTLNNAITIDVEDWYHVCGLEQDPMVPSSQFRVRRNIETILGLLSEHSVRATFFILGQIAEADPELAPLIMASGHEIASHGYSHRLVTKLSADDFRSEVRRTGDIIERQTGVKPIGFRAPQWSLSLKDTPWAFEILAQEGYVYDSSLNPLPFVGDNKGAKTPFTIATNSGKLLEIPPMVGTVMAINLPIAGGWAFRLFPLLFVKKTIKAYNDSNYPAIIYLHPREIDPDGPRLKLSTLKSFATYGTRQDATPRLKDLFEKFSFTTMRELASA